MTRKTGALIAGLAAGLTLLAMADVASAQAAESVTLYTTREPALIQPLLAGHGAPSATGASRKARLSWSTMSLQSESCVKDSRKNTACDAVQYGASGKRMPSAMAEWSVMKH